MYWLDKKLMARLQWRDQAEGETGNLKPRAGAGPISADQGEHGLGGRRVQLEGTKFLILQTRSGSRWRRTMDGLHRDDEVADGIQWIGKWVKVK